MGIMRSFERRELSDHKRDHSDGKKMKGWQGKCMRWGEWRWFKGRKYFLAVKPEEFFCHEGQGGGREVLQGSRRSKSDMWGDRGATSSF